MKKFLALIATFAVALALFVGIGAKPAAAAPFKNQGVQYQEYVYDFSVDGGAAGFIDLSAKTNKKPIPASAIIKSVTYRVLTAPTSGGSATIALGDATTAARYLAATAYNNAAYALDNVAAAAIGVPNLVAAANGGKFGVTIATAALTAGKIAFYVEFYYPNN